MIIISKFHDYYDGVSKSGIDTTLRYIREKKIVYENNRTYEYNWARKWRDIPLHHSIGFCGKIYSVFEYNKQFVYSLEDYENIFKLKFRRNIQNSNFKWIIDDNSLFEKYKTPIYTSIEYNDILRNKHGHIFELNSQLKQYEFYRIFDSWRAYQEISMWLGNQAAPEKPIPYIPDDIMAQAKGFNKYSFRKDKQK